jgi:hypothetical protein
VNIICQNWAELCAEIQNCPLLGQEKMDAVARDFAEIDAADESWGVPA